ncbi:MAG: hypothetical protein R2771_06555 [Saprospiraceae bacterium]
MQHDLDEILIRSNLNFCSVKKYAKFYNIPEYKYTFWYNNLEFENIKTKIKNRKKEVEIKINEFIENKNQIFINDIVQEFDFSKFAETPIKIIIDNHLQSLNFYFDPIFGGYKLRTNKNVHNGKNIKPEYKKNVEIPPIKLEPNKGDKPKNDPPIIDYLPKNPFEDEIRKNFKDLGQLYNFEQLIICISDAIDKLDGDDFSELKYMDLKIIKITSSNLGKILNYKLLGQPTLDFKISFTKITKKPSGKIQLILSIKNYLKNQFSKKENIIDSLN